MGRRAVGLASEAGWRILARSGSRTSTLSGDHDWAQRPWGALRPGGTVTNGTRPGPPGQLSVQAGEPGREEWLRSVPTSTPTASGWAPAGRCWHPAGHHRVLRAGYVATATTIWSQPCRSGRPRATGQSSKRRGSPSASDALGRRTAFARCGRAVSRRGPMTSRCEPPASPDLSTRSDSELHRHRELSFTSTCGLLSEQGRHRARVLRRCSATEGALQPF
jgi:hypothetical protein